MRLQTLSSTGDAHQIPSEVSVKRSDPIYNAHGYLTKVPVAAIVPFIEAFTKPGDTVLDLYAGSGMTGVAATMVGRRAELRDISALGRHIGSNYVNLVDPAAFCAAAASVIQRAQRRLGDVYSTRCAKCDKPAGLSKVTWSKVYECSKCKQPVNYYRSLEAADWAKLAMACPHCAEPLVIRKAKQIGEEAVLDTVACDCSSNMHEQEPTKPLHATNVDGLTWPDVAIGEDRQMFAASALSKHGLLTIASFFSTRNLAVLAALREEISQVEDEAIRNKLLFAFTAILARASKRYQWSKKRPLNAANQNYYIAPVFYEWNVYELYGRKLNAVMRSDDYLREHMAEVGIDEPCVNYVAGSADKLDLADGSIDYVFTDPPFGSNIFYSDMNLFQEAWIGTFTDNADEAVVDRSNNGRKKRTAERYEELITDSLKECDRVLKPGGWLSLVFSNSSGEMWALVQRAVHAAGFSSESIAVLDKGQRSVKGLASGFENVVVADLIISMRRVDTKSEAPVTEPVEGYFQEVVARILASGEATTPSHVYLGVIREYLRNHVDATEVGMDHIAQALSSAGYEADSSTGKLDIVGDSAAAA